MLIKIEENKYLNADFIIVLFLVEPKGEDKEWQILARMLDASSQLLLSSPHKMHMQNEFKRLIKEANKRIKEIKYED